MYKDLHQPCYAHNRKAKDALELDGWVDNRSNMPFQQYPRMIYGPMGEQVVVGKYGKDGTVNVAQAKMEEAAWLEKGYSLSAIAAPEPEPEVTPAPVTASTNTRQDVLEAEIKQLKELLALTMAAKETKAFGTGRRRGRKPAETVTA